ncbi:PEP-CTERM sorting domain-containing protein [Aquabacterium sp.]|uniref:PEP-CTERM sorting domain-containing protein n=1 Tax=Aquabacterium sp. TaxID=1872578 RepID=UPI0037848B1B
MSTPCPRLPSCIHPLATAALALGLLGAGGTASAAYVAGTTVQTGIDGYTQFGYSQQLSASDSHTATAGNQSSSALAAANLADGTLHVRASSVGTNEFAFANALFGDSFTHHNGVNPFVWGNSQATFNVHIDGVETFSPGSGNNNPTRTNFALISLMIFAPGQLSTSSCNTTHMFSWSIGDFGTPQDFCGNNVLGNLSGAVDSDLQAQFAPGSDFDWLLVIRVGGGIDNANIDTAWTQDFANTATLSYVAPDGATVTSSSGVFPGTTGAAVPEPASWLLVLGALGAAGLAARRPQRRHIAVS